MPTITVAAASAAATYERKREIRHQHLPGASKQQTNNTTDNIPLLRLLVVATQQHCAAPAAVKTIAGAIVATVATVVPLRHCC